MPERAPLPVISASEVNEHAYCARSWWLSRVRGYRSAHVKEMSLGQAAHESHGRLVMRSSRVLRVAYVLLGLAVLVAALGLWSMLKGL